VHCASVERDLSIRITMPNENAAGNHFLGRGTP
jgi:hypothetical protein